MKKTLIIVLSALTLGTTGFGQTKTSKNAKLEKQIIALDISGWEAWKTNNVKWFQTNTAPEFMAINSGVISTRADVIKYTPTGCEVKSYSLDDFKFVVLSENTVLLTYTAFQDAVCDGKKIPEKVRAAVTYIKRGGRWLEACFMDSPILQ